MFVLTIKTPALTSGPGCGLLTVRADPAGSGYPSFAQVQYQVPGGDCPQQPLTLAAR
jgi:hypothetical protein